MSKLKRVELVFVFQDDLGELSPQEVVRRSQSLGVAAERLFPGMFVRAFIQKTIESAGSSTPGSDPALN